ncbi:MAG: hypothetical protein JOZ99_00205 [Actinobacteria bacterium]|nr:hypothetical protein [Actinomycetota bacterium]
MADLKAILAAEEPAFARAVEAIVTGDAASLERELAAAGADVQREDTVVTAVWPATDADETERWEEYTFTELVFFLRAWAGTDPRRRVDVLEERVV